MRRFLIVSVLLATSSSFAFFNHVENNARNTLKKTVRAILTNNHEAFNENTSASFRNDYDSEDGLAALRVPLAGKDYAIGDSESVYQNRTIRGVACISYHYEPSDLLTSEAYNINVVNKTNDEIILNATVFCDIKWAYTVRDWNYKTLPCYAPYQTTCKVTSMVW